MAVRVLQLSDLHITTDGERFGQDPRANLDRVLDDVDRRGLTPDVVVATGDLGDTGDPAEYAYLRERLGALGVLVFCLAGNHDAEPAFTTHLPGGTLSAVDAATVDGWRFLFLDANARGRVVRPDGTVVDREDRRHDARSGGLLPADGARLVDALAADADGPTMIWTHHPAVAHPGFVGLDEAPFSRWFVETVGAAGSVRAVSSGHVHSSHASERLGVHHFTCPSGWLALDLDAGTLMPPGYRWFELGADGTVVSEAYVVADGRGPEATPYPDWVPRVLAEGG
ncbi:MAG: hypothetical protein FJW95_04120 [Actinobacteria bacterium]|nr:hypothetical protein [Actinomycetota bacterium]